MEKSTKIVMVLALMLATSVVSLEGRKLNAAEPKDEPQTFPGFPGGPGLGSGSGLIPGFGLGQPAFGGGGPLLPGIGLGSNPLIPGGGSGGVPAAGQP